MAGRVGSAIQADVYRLICRLRVALQLEEASPEPWRESLFALVGQTPRGIWTVEARLLYDLQKVCVDYERDIYTVDLVEWALSWGRRPIKRPLPNQRDVLMLKHLAQRRAAAGRGADFRRTAAATRPAGAGGDRPGRGAAPRAAPSENRRRAGRRGAGAAEPARARGPEETGRGVARPDRRPRVLDDGRLARRHFAQQSQIARPLRARSVFCGGDQLLRADRKLAAALDGVYRRGEFYLRWMQRLSSLGFGTGIGRFSDALCGRALRRRVRDAGLRPPFARDVAIDQRCAVPPRREAEFDDVSKRSNRRTGFASDLPAMVLLLGFLFLCLVNSAALPRALGSVLHASYWVFRALVDRADPLGRSVAALCNGSSTAGCSRFFSASSSSRCFGPLPPGGSFPRRPTGGLPWAWRASTFLTFNLLLNSRLGATLEEVVADGIVQAWRRFGLRMIIGLFWFFVDVFRRLVETIERLMYAVDEWLRFRAGEGRAALIAKAALGLAWFFVAYLLRFAVNVLYRTAVQPDQAFPGGHGGPQTAAGDVQARSTDMVAAWTRDWRRSRRGHRRHCHLVHSRHFRFPGVGIEGELAAVCGQSPPDARPGNDRLARREHAAAAEAGLSFRHVAQALRQAPPCRTPRPGRRKLASRA